MVPYSRSYSTMVTFVIFPRFPIRSAADPIMKIITRRQKEWHSRGLKCWGRPKFSPLTFKHNSSNIKVGTVKAAHFAVFLFNPYCACAGSASSRPRPCRRYGSSTNPVHLFVLLCILGGKSISINNSQSLILNPQFPMPPSPHTAPCDDIIVLKEKVAALEVWRISTEADLKEIHDTMNNKEKNRLGCNNSAG